MGKHTDNISPIQPFSAALRQVIITLINSADNHSDREYHIETALTEGAIDPATAQALRCGEI